MRGAELMTTDPLIGALLSDRFRILQPIEHAGLNQLYAGEDVNEPGRRVLVKFLYRGYLSTRRAEARYREEIRKVQGLSSEHVGRVLDLGVTEHGDPYVVSELLEGEDLGRLLAREGRLSVRRAVSIAIQALRGLNEAHAAGLLHFNLKPENLLIVQRGRSEVCQLLDFGLSRVRVSRFWRHLEPEQRSLVYAAPEQLDEAAQPDERADLYSIAAVLYECLTGRPPHSAHDEATLIQQIRSEKPVRADALRPEVPAALAEVIQRGLATSASRRFDSAEELEAALSPFLQTARAASGKASAAARPARNKPWWMPSTVAASGKKPWWLSPGFLGVLAGVSVLFVVFVSRDRVASRGAEALFSAEPAVTSPAPAAPAPPPVAPSAVPLPSASVSPAPAPSASALAPAGSAGGAAAEPGRTMLCYLNRISGVVATRPPRCPKPVFVKPNMTRIEKFPKWIPGYCKELAVYHCETASAPPG